MYRTALGDEVHETVSFKPISGSVNPGPSLASVIASLSPAAQQVTTEGQAWLRGMESNTVASRRWQWPTVYTRQIAQSMLDVWRLRASQNMGDRMNPVYWQPTKAQAFDRVYLDAIANGRTPPAPPADAVASLQTERPSIAGTAATMMPGTDTAAALEMARKQAGSIAGQIAAEVAAQRQAAARKPVPVVTTKIPATPPVVQGTSATDLLRPPTEQPAAPIPAQALETAAAMQTPGTSLGTIAVIAGAVALTWYLTKKGK